jgi:hypothetical protein
LTPTESPPREVDAGAVDDLRHLVVPDHHADDLLACALHAAQRRQVHQTL